MSPARWQYLKALRPHPSRLIHQSAAVAMIPNPIDPLAPPLPWIEKPGHTYSVGRNAAKRARRIALQELRT